MIVKLDLRPESVKNIVRPKTRKVGLFMFCMFLVFGSIVSYAGFSMVNDIIFLQSEINKLAIRIDNLNIVKAGLTSEIGRLAQQEAIYVSSLSIMQQELPTIEVIDSIDRSLIKGVTLNSLALTEKDLRLDGVANFEDSIVESTRDLLSTGTYSIAQVPVVTRTDMGPEGLKFTLSLAPLTIGEVSKQ